MSSERKIWRHGPGASKALLYTWDGTVRDGRDFGLGPRMRRALFGLSVFRNCHFYHQWQSLLSRGLSHVVSNTNKHIDLVDIPREPLPVSRYVPRLYKSLRILILRDRGQYLGETLWQLPRHRAKAGISISLRIS